ncbi:GIY-YIG nuclease family protein [Nocardioides salsibiostraticola]
MSIGRSVRLFLADGTPGGLVTAEIMNWSGHVLMAPRSQLSALIKREESRRTGVYILIGDDPASVGEKKIYVGEGDDVSTRLKSHEASKDFWDQVVVLTSKDSNLTKAHVRFLESRLIGVALNARRSEVTNGTAPSPPPLPEADASDMDFYLTQVQIILPVLSVNVFRTPSTPTGTAPTTAATSPRFVAGLKGETWATAEEIDGEFTVLSGSRAKRWKGVETAYQALQEKLIADGTLLVSADGDLTFTHDQVFGSPSAAAAVVFGRNSNGRLEWRIEATKMTYAGWLDQQLVQAP